MTFASTAWSPRRRCCGVARSHAIGRASEVPQILPARGPANVVPTICTLGPFTPACRPFPNARVTVEEGHKGPSPPHNYRPCPMLPSPRCVAARDTQCKGRTRCPQPQPHSPTQLFVPLEQNSTAAFALTSARRRKAHPTFCSKWNAIILILICNACRETAVMRRTRGWTQRARDARAKRISVFIQSVRVRRFGGD